MSSHFNLKSLAFYTIAIGLVLLLFRVVSAYGEANLKAPPPIDGRYRLSYSPKPNCPQPNSLMLTVAQSGTYLNGSLSVIADTVQPAKASEQKSSLAGRLNAQQLSFTGTVPTSALCTRSVPHPTSRVNIQSRVEGANLQGQMTLIGTSEAIEFTAQREAPVQRSEGSTNH